MTELSAVIPTYNRSGTIERAIDSVLAQEVAPDEVIVVDDGSTDNTQEVLSRYTDRITLVSQENAGVSAARNRGVAAASGEWVAFLDSDDYWLPGYLQGVTAAIEATEGGACCYFADVEREVGGGLVRLWDQAGFEPAAPYELVEDGADWLLRERQPMLPSAAVIRRSTFTELGGFCSQLVTREDTHMFFRVGLSRPICAVATVASRATDDSGAQRETSIHVPQTRVYAECTAALYDDLLARTGSLRPAQRNELRRRSAQGHLRLGQHLASSEPLTAARHAAIGVRLAPTLVARRAHSKLKRTIGWP